jgi:peptidoglycan/LPS O-acetylase OafA/YrhL
VTPTAAYWLDRSRAWARRWCSGRSGALAGDPLRRDRSDGIDALRALLALWVVLAHLIPWSVEAQGPEAVPAWIVRASRLPLAIFQPVGELHPAVVIFIILSGYCIHRSGLRTQGAGEIAGYAIRRFFRIAPLYYIAIAAGVIGFLIASRQSLALASGLSGTQEIAGSCVAAKILVLSAFYPGFHECAFLGNAPLATVLVEIVLYVLYAATFAGLIWRGREPIVWLGGAALFLGTEAMLARGVSPGFYAWWQNGSIFGFLPYWWLGVAFVNPAFARACARKLWLIALAWGVLTAMILLMSRLPAPLAVAEARKLCFALGVGVAIYAIDNVRLKGLGGLSLIGRAGYGLYAIHAPLTYTLTIYGVPWWAILIANVLAALVIYRLIERPLIGVGRVLVGRLARRPIAAPVQVA